MHFQLVLKFAAKYKTNLVMSMAALTSLALMSCGGGDKSAVSPATIRPKTLDGIDLILDSNVTFEFVRNTGTPPAAFNGDVESGTFFYTLGGVQARQYPNIQGDNSDVHYPDSISTATYTYRAINDASGLLTLNGFGVNDLILTGTYNARNGSFGQFFNSDSAGNVINKLEVDMTFTAAGGSITIGTTTVRIPGSTTPYWDTVRIPATVKLAAGGLVPENYNPTIDFLRPSRLCPASLTDTLINFTNGAGVVANNFTIQFTADANGIIRTGPLTPDEIGLGLMRIADAPIDYAVTYTWRRVPGTDTATLVLSGGNNTFDGSYTLAFAGTDNGIYTGTADSMTPDPAVVSGTFNIPKPK